MEEINVKDIIEMLNTIDDYLWLGDYESSVKLITSYINNLKPDIISYINLSYGIKHDIHNIRKNFNEIKKRKNQKLDDYIVEHIYSKKYDMLSNSYGVLLNLILKYRDMVESGALIYDYKIVNNNHDVVHVGINYRYIMYKMPEQWEIRIIMNTDEFSLGDLKRLNDYNVNYITINKYNEIVELFSSYDYINIIRQEKRLLVQLRTINETYDKINSSVKMILDTIVHYIV